MFCSLARLITRPHIAYIPSYRSLWTAGWPEPGIRVRTHPFCVVVWFSWKLGISWSETKSETVQCIARQSIPVTARTHNTHLAPADLTHWRLLLLARIVPLVHFRVRKIRILGHFAELRPRLRQIHPMQMRRATSDLNLLSSAKPNFGL